MNVFGFSENGFPNGETPEYLLEKNQLSEGANLKLYNAVLAQSLMGVQTALSKGASVNYFHRPEDHKNALHLSSEEGYSEIVAELISHNAVIDAIAAPSKSTALILAATNSHTDIMELLINANANPNLKNMYGNTALHESARALNIVGCTLLLNSGANIINNNKGSTALHFICYEEKDAKQSVLLTNVILEHLENNGKTIEDIKSIVNTPDARGTTPLLICCSTGNLSLLKKLLEKGADINAVDGEGRNGIKIADFYRKQKVSDHLKSLLGITPETNSATPSPRTTTTTATAGNSSRRSGLGTTSRSSSAGGTGVNKGNSTSNRRTTGPSTTSTTSSTGTARSSGVKTSVRSKKSTTAK